eukprot:COSAG01_NODE_2653_length_7307_cov_31.893868_10_plen_54_part_00
MAFKRQKDPFFTHNEDVCMYVCVVYLLTDLTVTCVTDVNLCRCHDYEASSMTT